VEDKTTNNNGPQKIYRSKSQRVIGGVCGGMAEYFNIDVLLIRLAWIFATLLAGSGIIGYIACLILIPDNPDQQTPEKHNKTSGEGARFWGIVLIIIGAVFLVQQTGILYRLNFFHVGWPSIFAVGFIILGIYLMINRKKDSADSEEGQKTSAAPSERPFYRIEEGKMLSGVCTGLAYYFDIDVTLVRLLWVFLTLASAGVGIVAYIIAIIVLPSIPDHNHIETAGDK